jgi:site-specific recombinase XerD
MHQIDRQMFQIELPEVTIEFLEFVGKHLKKSTCYNYKSGLKHFYLFCKKENLTPEHMKRRHFESFLKYLMKTGLSPTGRKSIIMRVRSYLRWLYEHDHLKESPETLLKTSDIPKIPKYLPRPIPFEIDQELQNRFSSSDDIYHQALLLIRKTGMRAGEALLLSYDCLKNDGYGNYSLKVPLGKLNKERMVPLDIDTVNLIEAIRKQCDGYSKKKRNYLICTPSGCKISYLYLMFAFKESTYDIKTDQPLVIHRLRHSYATTLLNAGMSLLSLKEVLGHQDVKMTLCYASITQKTVRDEYFSAMKNLTDQYQHSKIQKIDPSSNSHLQTCDDLILGLKKSIGDNKRITPKRMTTIMKRIARLQSDLAHLLEE